VVRSPCVTQLAPNLKAAFARQIVFCSPSFTVLRNLRPLSRYCSSTVLLDSGSLGRCNSSCAHFQSNAGQTVVRSADVIQFSPTFKATFVCGLARQWFVRPMLFNLCPLSKRRLCAFSSDSGSAGASLLCPAGFGRRFRRVARLIIYELTFVRVWLSAHCLLWNRRRRTPQRQAPKIPSKASNASWQPHEPPNPPHPPNLPWGGRLFFTKAVHNLTGVASADAACTSEAPDGVQAGDPFCI
jgi:hypothetical protein